jgi:phosphoribosylglycinamide formyltransferase 1
LDPRGYAVSSGGMSVRIAVLASGSGSNAQVLLDASARDELAGGEVVVVVSDRQAKVLELAHAAGVESLLIDHKEYPSRVAFGEAVLDELRSRQVRLVCYAGWMRIMPPEFIQAFPGRVLNIHPALLPSFPGAHAVRDALEWGVKVTGTTVHFADEDVDHGPIIMQEAVPVLAEDTEVTLHERVKEVEHRLYPEAVRAVVSGRVRLEGRTVHILETDGAPA